MFYLSYDILFAVGLRSVAAGLNESGDLHFEPTYYFTPTNTTCFANGHPATRHLVNGHVNSYQVSV